MVILGAGYMSQKVFSHKTEDMSETWLEVRRTEILELLKSDASFNALIALNDPPMPCLLTQTGCPAIDTTITRPFRMKISGPPGADTIDGALPAVGFDTQGNVCNTFDTGDASGTCLYGVDLYWKLICNGSAECRNPEAQLIARFHYMTRNNADPRAKSYKNMNKYMVSVVRGQRLNTIWETCTAMNGVFNPPTSCQPQYGSCPAGDFVVGFDADGLPTCRSLDFSCAAGQAMTGFNPDGTVICSAGCP